MIWWRRISEVLVKDYKKFQQQNPQSKPDQIKSALIKIVSRLYPITLYTQECFCEIFSEDIVVKLWPTDVYVITMWRCQDLTTKGVQMNLGWKPEYISYHIYIVV